jgi:hypothetical protein
MARSIVTEARARRAVHLLADIHIGGLTCFYGHVKSLRNALGDRPVILRKATLNELV